MTRPHAAWPCRYEPFGVRPRLPDRLPWPLAFVAIAALAVLAWAALLLLGWLLLT